MPDPTAPPVPGDGLALPRDPAARYGDGLGLGLSLGGGGVFFVAWQVAYLHELDRLGVSLAGADRVVGTSAGSLVAAVVEAGHLGRLHAELGLLSKAPRLVGALAPAGDLHPSQVRARDLFAAAPDAGTATVRAVGHAALAARAPAPAVMARHIGAVLASRRWPSPALHVTCVDAYTAERCVVTRASGVGVARAVAASSAVPGLFSPQPIGDRRCMDGGVSGTGTHLDLLAGCRRAVVVCLTDGHDVTAPRMTTAPGAIEAEVGSLRSSGAQVFLRTPAAVDVATLMDPAAVPDALAMGRRQAEADVADLADFLA